MKVAPPILFGITSTILIIKMLECLARKFMNKPTVLVSAITLLVLSAGIVIPQAFAAGPPRDWTAHSPIFVIKPSSATPVGLTPSQIRHIYGFDLLSCTFSGTFGSTTLCGTGQTVAIVDAFDDPGIESDLGTFSSTFALPSCTTANGCFTKATPQGAPRTDRGWALEISLDVEWAHAIAPGAKILLVESLTNSFTNLFGAVDFAARQAGVHQVSMSWGGGEFSTESSFDSHFSVSGVTFTASSGDGGNGIIYPSASPLVVSVGGTTLNLDSSGNLVSETAWSGSGGGISKDETEPSYQTNYPIPSTGGFRGNPDVSYDADPASGVAVFDSLGFQGLKNWIQVGGTSAGAPQWAALFAIANAGRAAGRSSPLGSTSTTTPTNVALYSIAKTAYATNYRDITSGTNGNCGAICTAGPNYDFVTGLGSPLANNIIASLVKA